MPNVGLEMRRIKNLSVEEWNVLSQKLDSIMIELGYDSKKILESRIVNFKRGTEKRDWLEFLRKCKPKDIKTIPSDMLGGRNYVGCRWFSLHFSTKGQEEDSFIPRELDVRPSTGWGSCFFADAESVVIEKIEMLFLGPFRTYYKCLYPVTKNFRTNAEEKRLKKWIRFSGFDGPPAQKCCFSDMPEIKSRNTKMKILSR